jgi:hypothetical protein
LPDVRGVAGSLCAVRGAQLAFAWFSTPEGLEAAFARNYPSCRRVSYVLVCSGRERQALRYADPRFVLQVTARKSDRSVLLRVPLNPSTLLLLGSRVT